MYSSLKELLSGKTLYIFGAGQRGERIYSMLESCGMSVRAFIDNSIEKQGQKVCNKECLSLDEFIGEGGAADRAVIVSPRDHDSILEQLKKCNVENVYDGEEIIKNYFFIPIVKEKEDYNNVRPFNYYESPYPDIREIHEKEDEIFDDSREVLGIDFNIDRQFELLEKMKQIDAIEWGIQKQPEYRYYYGNSCFGRGSADVLHYMMRILKPNKIIEVGSGFSTSVMLDTNNNCLKDSIEIKSIEPDTKRLRSLLREHDNLEIHECCLQDISLDFFGQLKENDILFIDSSHVSRINSDVNYYLFEIFPRLNKGVYIHFHDMFYPFIYPKQWIYEGRAYNELYLLRAFLMNNNAFSVQFFGELLMKKYPEKLNEKLQDISGSLWIRKDC